MTYTKWDLSEYEDPALYDMENKGCPELSLLLSQIQQKVVGTGPIVDLACGTGRLTIPVAEAGYAVIGIDLHEGMLEQARAKASPRSDISIQWMQQDLTALNLVTEAPFAYMVGNSFQHFLTNELQNRLLQSVRSLLTDNGIFIFDTRFPTSDELLQASFWFVNHIFVSLFNRLYTIRNKKESMIFTHAGTFIIQYNRGGTVR